MASKKMYLIDVENEVIFVTYTGNIELNDLKELELNLSIDSNFSKSFNRIYDLRYCQLKIKIDQIPEFIDFEKNEIDTDFLRKEIFLTKTPNDVVITTMYSNAIKSFQLQPHIISSTVTIEQLISIPNLDKKSIDKTLRDLRK